MVKRLCSIRSVLFLNGLLLSAGVHAACSPNAAPQLGITQAFIRLQECNRDILIAENAVSATKADLQSADRGQNPMLTLGAATINPQNGIGPGPLSQKQIDWQARVDQVIERGNKRGLRVTAAEKAVAAAHWNAAEALRQQRLALANAWIDLWAAQERVKVLTEILSLYRRTQDAAQKRLRAGDIAANDLLRISVDTERAQNDVQQASVENMRARYALAAILAIESQAATLTVTEPWPVLTLSETQQKNVASSALGRPDVRAARMQLEAAAAGRDLALSQRTRDVSVGVQFDRYAQPAGTGNTVGLSVSIPLFLRHAYEGEIARAEADYTTALLTLRKAEQQAGADQSRLMHERREAHERANRLRSQQLPMAEKLAANAELAYKKGASGVFDLLDALKQLRQIQLDLLAAQTDYEKSDAADRAAGLISETAEDPLFSRLTLLDK